MTETGKIIKIEGNRVTLGVCGEESCQACGGSCSIKEKERVFTALNSRDLSLQAGDEVEVYISAGKTLKASFMLLILPLLLFIIFYAGAGGIFKGASEAVKALGGVAGLASGFGINYLYKILRKQPDMPEIIGKRGPF
ncbi:MAG: SoxR reducing system RseC family protein [Spirochaetota bacterium]